MTGTLHAPLLEVDPERLGAPAFLHGERVLSYGELRASAIRGAAALNHRGCGQGRRVAVALPKGLAAIQAIFSGLAAGAAVIPIDSLAPAARICGILEDASPALLITSPELATRLRQTGRPLPETLRVASGDDPFPGGSPSPDEFTWGPVPPDSPAILYYTSGTTGTPKAIVLSHGNVSSFVDWAVERLGLGPGDRFTNHAPLHFDLSTLDLFAAVRVGASTVLIDDVSVRFPARVAQIIEATGVSVWYSVPTALVLLLRHGALERRRLERLRLVLFAGETFPVSSLRELMARLPRPRYVNLYGPTETNVCTYHVLPGPPPVDALEIPIGIPCEHLRVSLLDERGLAVEPGQVGEIAVHGPAVMTGYWGHDQLTRETRLNGEPGSYRTGDFARLDGQGLLYLLGRRDDQVKIRGHRLELLEVSAVLAAHPDVQEAVALVSGEPPRLVAAATPEAGHPVSVNELRAHCSERLPAYAVPEEIRFLEALPRTSTGKLDRRALAAAWAQPGPGEAPGSNLGPLPAGNHDAPFDTATEPTRGA